MAFSGCTNLNGVLLSEGLETLGGGAFKDTAITEIEIPASLTEIGGGYAYGMFSGCGQLVSVTVNRGNQTYHSAGNCIIETATGTLAAGCNVSVIPEDGSVTAIGKYAFEGCAFTELHMPDSVTELGNRAFANCVNLTQLPLTGNVSTIGSQAFLRCDGLVNAVIPDGVTEIGATMFSYCINLESVRISESVTTIGNGAFLHCEKLKTVNIPSGVTEIGGNAFMYCYSLESFTVPGNVKEIRINTFANCKGLKKVVIEDGVEEIEYSTFSGCTALEEIKLPKSLLRVGTLFGRCDSLQTVRFAGTLDEWNTLMRGQDLPDNCLVVCSDGTVLPSE